VRNEEWKLGDIGLLYASGWRHDLEESGNPAFNHYSAATYDTAFRNSIRCQYLVTFSRITVTRQHFPLFLSSSVVAGYTKIKLKCASFGGRLASGEKSKRRIYLQQEPSSGSAQDTSWAKTRLRGLGLRLGGLKPPKPNPGYVSAFNWGLPKENFGYCSTPYLKKCLLLNLVQLEEPWTSIHQYSLFLVCNILIMLVSESIYNFASNPTLTCNFSD